MVFDISTSLKNLTEKCENITHFIYLTEILTEFWWYEFGNPKKWSTLRIL